MSRRAQIAADPIPSAVLRLREVQLLTGLGRTSIHSLVVSGQFPKPVRLTKAARGWIAREVLQWIDERARERDA